MNCVDWASIGKVTLSILFSFGSGWATAILSDVSPEKALASGVVAAGTYWLGSRQQPGTIAKDS